MPIDTIADELGDTALRLHLRYAGTDTFLPVSFGPHAAVLDAFTAAHRQRFGFATPEREVVVEACVAEVTAAGEAATHVLAFDRGGVVSVATRLPVGLAARGWGDTVVHLPDGRWADLLTGREYVSAAPAHELLADLPVALLILEHG